MTQLDKSQIEDLIPHRAPFLWIDRVLEMDDNHILAEKDITDDLDLFQGHYPNFPVLPGVIQCEACFQASAILISKIEPTKEGEVPVVTRLTDVQFRKMIRPETKIQLDVTIDERLANAFYLSGKVLLDGKVATRLKFVCTAAPAPSN